MRPKLLELCASVLAQIKKVLERPASKKRYLAALPAKNRGDFLRNTNTHPTYSLGAASFTILERGNQNSLRGIANRFPLRGPNMVCIVLGQVCTRTQEQVSNIQPPQVFIWDARVGTEGVLRGTRFVSSVDPAIGRVKAYK